MMKSTNITWKSNDPHPETTILTWFLRYHLEAYIYIYGIFILTFYLTFFLGYTLTFYLTFHLASILTYFLAYILTLLLLEFYLASILTLFLAFYLTFSLASGWGPGVPTEIWRSLLRSSAHWDLELAVEVPPVPTEIWRSWLRSSSAHCCLQRALKDLEDEEEKEEEEEDGTHLGKNLERPSPGRREKSTIKSP